MKQRATLALTILVLTILALITPTLYCGETTDLALRDVEAAPSVVPSVTLAEMSRWDPEALLSPRTIKRAITTLAKETIEQDKRLKKTERTNKAQNAALRKQHDALKRYNCLLCIGSVIITVVPFALQLFWPK